MRIGIIVACFLCVPAVLQAAVVRAVSERELARRSNAIVIGSVIRTDTTVKDGNVATRATVQVHQSLRGPANNAVITLIVPGGRLANGIAASVPGAPHLDAGDTIFAFLEGEEGFYRPLGLSYGLLRVRTDARGQRRVYRESDGLTLMGPSGEVVSPGEVALRDVPLAEMVERILAHLAELDIPRPGTVKP